MRSKVNRLEFYTVCFLLWIIAVTGRSQATPPGMRSDLEPRPTPEQVGRTWVEIDGEIYGAQPGDLGPIGGGAGYSRIFTNGDYNVATVDEMLAVLEKAESGEVVYLDPSGDFDFTTLVYAEENFKVGIPGGVTLASNRGHNGSRGAVVYSDAFQTRLIHALGPNVRIAGLWLRGPDPKQRVEHHRRSFHAKHRERHSRRWPDAGQRTGHRYYYQFPTSRGVSTEFDGLVVDNCEISGWTHAGIFLSAGKDHHVHHNYIHRCQYHGLGYGVSHGRGDAVSLIEYNLFDANRHSIAASGYPGNAYEARHNVELGVASGHCFDMHGAGQLGDKTNIAGNWMKIYNNTFRAPIRAIAVRGTPLKQVEIHNNWFYHREPGSLMLMPWPPGGDTLVQLYNNAYGLEEPVSGRNFDSFANAFEEGMLRCGPGHSEIILTRPIPGLHRFEFEVMTDVDRPCDLSPAIHIPDTGATIRERGGYLMQFGGAGNTLNRIMRNAAPLEERSIQRFIEPGRMHTVTAELDGDIVRLMVDGQIIVEAHDEQPLTGPGHDRAGLYLFNITRIDAVRVYTSGD